MAAGVWFYCFYYCDRPHAFRLFRVLPNLFSCAGPCGVRLGGGQTPHPLLPQLAIYPADATRPRRYVHAAPPEGQLPGNPWHQRWLGGHHLHRRGYSGCESVWREPFRSGTSLTWSPASARVCSLGSGCWRELALACACLAVGIVRRFFSRKRCSCRDIPSVSGWT